MHPNAIYVEARSQLPTGEQAIHRIVSLANTIRQAQRAKWTPPMIRVLEDDLIRELTSLYRRAEDLDSPNPKRTR